MSNYASISQIGGNDEYSPMANPLSYCAVSSADSNFTHTLGQTFGPESSQCQQFMSLYCANDWDDICESKSYDSKRGLPNMNPMNSVEMCVNDQELTQGEILIANTASEKYLSMMSGNCQAQYEPFDPTVASSPLIRKLRPVPDDCTSRNGQMSLRSSSNKCIPIYEVDPKTIDNDPVMNKIIAKPAIWINGLLNIYRNAKRNGKLKLLKNTRLYKHVFSNPSFQRIADNHMVSKVSGLAVY